MFKFHLKTKQIMLLFDAQYQNVPGRRTRAKKESFIIVYLVILITHYSLCWWNSFLDIWTFLLREELKCFMNDPGCIKWLTHRKGGTFQIPAVKILGFSSLFWFSNSWGKPTSSAGASYSYQCLLVKLFRLKTRKYPGSDAAQPTCCSFLTKCWCSSW